MKRTALLLFVLAACTDAGNNPLGGGVNPPPPSGDDDDDIADASVGADAADAAGPLPDATPVDGIAGQMCRADSLLAPEACPTDADFTGVIAAHVETGAFDEASADGTFLLPPAAGGAFVATLRLAPSDPNYRPSLIPIALRSDGTAGPMRLPVMLEEDWVTLTNTIGASDLPGDGAIIIYVVDASGPVEGAVVVGADDGEIYYDNGGALEWDQAVDGTDAAGVILITTVDSIFDTRTITIQSPTTTKTFLGIPIAPNTLTFITADL